jgi:hypothetical protein
MKLVPVTAMIEWEEKFRGELNWGSVVILTKDGTVFEMATFRNRDGKVGYRDVKKRQTLPVLKKEFGKDLEGMARKWRFMMVNRRPGLEMMGTLHLERLAKEIN